MKVLAIESSCDETSAAVVEKTDEKIIVHSNVTATSLSIHAKTGGIIPENAAREQVKWIIPVIVDSLLASENISPDSSAVNFKTAQNILSHKIDAIAVTHGPGLIGSLFIGVETAKTLSFIMNKPLIPVNHLLAHIFANFISNQTKSYQLSAKSFPFIGLIISGGHTDLVYFESIKKFTWLGGTRDDAAGEALDKVGRLLGLSYPAGPEIEERASKVSKTEIHFKSPLLHEDTFDFSFSGLKTEVLRFVQQHKTMNNELTNQVCFALQKAVFDVLIQKALKAAEKYNCPTILLGGGVAANQTLRNEFEQSIINNQQLIKLFSPEKMYCTDNAAMIGAYAVLDTLQSPWKGVRANPELYFD